MGSAPRLTVRNLLNTWRGFPDQIRNDPWARSYTLGLSVVKYFLGEEWIFEHLQPQQSASGFLQPDLANPTNQEIQFFRTIDLGELLFNLQYIEGFDGCIKRLKGGDIQGSLAELDVARMLYINDQRFWFVERQKKKKMDFDFRVVFPGGLSACIEAKCNLETGVFNSATIKNALDQARTQLPASEPGIIFVKLPAQWITDPNFARKSIETAMTFMRGTQRIVSVKFYIAHFLQVNGILGQGHLFKELTNPGHRFDHTRDWSLLNNWNPPPSWNTMPKKYIRLVFFPDLEPPA
jgi:hypothetical protein